MFSEVVCTHNLLPASGTFFSVPVSHVKCCSGISCTLQEKAHGIRRSHTSSTERDARNHDRVISVIMSNSVHYCLIEEEFVSAGLSKENWVKIESGTFRMKTLRMVVVVGQTISGLISFSWPRILRTHDVRADGAHGTCSWTHREFCIQGIYGIHGSFSVWILESPESPEFRLPKCCGISTKCEKIQKTFFSNQVFKQRSFITSSFRTNDIISG